MPAFAVVVLGTIVTLSLSVLTYITMWGSKNHFPVRGRTVVLTGASSGLGLALSKQLATKGANVVLVAQNLSRLEKAVASVKQVAAEPSQRFIHLSYDLRSPESAPKLLAEVTSWNKGSPPDIVICCAGNSHPGFFHATDLETHRNQMDTVYWSAAYIAHATLSLWMENPPKSGQQVKPLDRHLVFTNSCLAFLPVVGYGPYTVCKAAMKAMHDTLIQECAIFNSANRRSPNSNADIRVHTIFPMGIQSPGLEHENSIKPAVTKWIEESDIPQPAEEVATASMKGLEAGRPIITTNLIGHVMCGAGMGGSMRHNLSEIFWNVVGFVVLLVAGADIMSKCRRWGKEKGMLMS